MSDRPVRVLLIEDNPGDARLVKEALSDTLIHMAVSLTNVERLAQGLEYLDAQPVDAVLLDLSLPDSSGPATFYRLYARARHVPVILLTGLNDDDLAQELMRAGAQDYLVKGEVDGRILKRSIRYAIERKLSEDNLRASEERYRTLIEQASDGIFIADAQGVVIEVNSAGCALLGYTREELLESRLNVNELSSPVEAFNEDFFFGRLASGEGVIREYELVCKDGSRVPVEISAKLLPDGRLQGIVRDIRARKMAEAALRESHDFNQMLLKALPFQMDIVDESGRILYVDPDTEAAFGGALLGRYCWEVYKDDRQPCRECPLHVSIEIGKTHVTKSSGVTHAPARSAGVGGRIFEITHTGMWYQGRKALLEIFQDVTENVQMEERLQTTLRQLKFHVENSPLALIEFDSQYRIKYWSNRAQEMFGWNSDEIMGKTIHEVRWVYTEDVALVDADIDKLLSAQRTSNVQTNRNYRKDGQVITCEWYSSVLLDDTGSLISVQCLVLDVTKRKQAEDALRESEAFGQAILSNSPMGISVRDRFGRLLTANPAWQKIWAMSDEEVERDLNLERDALVFNDSDKYLKPYFGELRKVYEQGGSLHVPDIRTKGRRPGSAGWVSQHFYSLFDERGQVNKVVVLTDDITERKNAEMALLSAHAELEQRVIDRTVELQSANMALEKAARMKDEFLASMSHELRTPLTGILGLSEALQMVTYGSLSDKQLKAIKNIETSGRHLLALINDMLDLSKIEAGMFDMQFAATSLDGVCQASLQLVKGMANQKHQQVSYAISPAGIVLRTDPRRLKQMLVNLLGNAVKFTSDGGSLGIDVKGLPENGQVRITVWDKGIGIQEDDLPRLFQPFVQLDSRLSRQYAGTGLGLSLVKRMAELQGGQIQVESSFGSGSRFSILLPWVTEGTQPLNFSRRVTDKIKRALTVEQTQENATRLTLLLSAVGLKNQVTLSPLGVLELAAQTWPDVIFLREPDPTQPGADLLDQLKSDPRTHDIPVVLITTDRARAAQAGADGILLEAYTNNDLHAELQRLAFRSQSLPPVAAYESPSELVQKRASQQENIVVLMADDNPLVVEMVSDFLRAHEMQVVAVNSGLRLLEGLAEIQPDILLVDIQMPGMNGFDVIRAIRAHDSALVAGLPVIAITALAMSGDRERCLEAGASEYMSKPLELKNLLETIHEMCGK